MKKHYSPIKIAATLAFWIFLTLFLINKNFTNTDNHTLDSFKTGTAIASISEDFTSESIKQPASDLRESKPVNEVLFKEIVGELKSGESFADSLKRSNVTAKVKQELIQTLTGTLDFKRLRPKDRYSIQLDENGELYSSTYESGPLNIYNVTKTDNGLIAEKASIPLEVKTLKISGTIKTSIFSSFIELGEKPKLIHGFADIFASKIDFNSEPRVGDKFSLVFEKYYKEEEFVGYGRILVANYEQSDHTFKGFWYSSEQTLAGHFNPEGEELGTSFIRSPIPFGRISSRFSYKRKHPILKVTRPHLGIDLAAPTGTPIMAASDGRVVFKGWKGGFGKTIVLKHGNGYKTHYGHMSRYKKGLKVGSRVNKQDTIGYVGSTGLSTGPHLDYRISYKGVFKNPFSIKFKPNSVLTGAELDKFKTAKDILAQLMNIPDAQKTLIVKSVVFNPDSAISFL